MFEPEKLYGTDDPELAKLAPKATWAIWRHRAKGPSFMRVGRRVFYRGKELNEWLDAQLVETGA